MRCPRCTGMKVPEVITDGGMKSLALRCVHCGDLTDCVINRNRRRASVVREGGRARPPVYGRNLRKWDWSSFG